MGEYALRRADRVEVKIGTCENMYYLRFDQRAQVSCMDGNTDACGRDVLALRFRFPWPDEDRTLPGEFERYDRAVHVPGFAVPAGVDHYGVQFVAQAGYVVTLPCPESLPALALEFRLEWPDPERPLHAAQIHRNGFRGAVQLAQQKVLADGRLVPVCRCGGCGSAWRLEDPAEIEALAVALRTEADARERLGRPNGTGAADRRWWDSVADRVLAGAQLVQGVAP